LKKSFQQRVGGSEDEKAVGVCIRYAMKALSNVSVLKIFDREGLSFDCSSVYEVMRVIKAGIDPERIELVS
jgi:diaminopimelate decarboxylase